MPQVRGFVSESCMRRPTLAHTGIYPQIPLLLSWGANNIVRNLSERFGDPRLTLDQGGTLKRAIGMAIIVSIGNCG